MPFLPLTFFYLSSAIEQNAAHEYPASKWSVELKKTRVSTNNLHAAGLLTRGEEKEKESGRRRKREKRLKNEKNDGAISLAVQLQITLPWQMGYYANSQSSSRLVSRLNYSRTVRGFWISILQRNR